MKKLTIIISLFALVSGCSWSMVTKAPPEEYYDKVQYSECTRNPAPYIVDFALGTAATASAFYLYKNAPDPSFDNAGTIQKATKAGSFGIGTTSLLFYGSGAYGVYQVSQCNKFWYNKQ